ncbi:hypothetical protein quinque_006018 [Culex quinquefasciatus]|uniref:putative helicase MOV-10 n=1 Tax=Culex quinquefasciatus TaxID=7176 RepID=UPI0018E37EC8|nr:putative helicase MOV-10 [Culex quinquefasciatus]
MTAKADKTQDILRKSLAKCFAEGSLAPDGLVPSEAIFELFSKDLFAECRKDVRLREFQALMQRSPLVLETLLPEPDRREYRVDLGRLLEEAGETEKVVEEAVDPVKSAKLSSKVDLLIGGIQKCALTRHESDEDLTALVVKIKHVTTVSRWFYPDYKLSGKSCIVCRLDLQSEQQVHQHYREKHGLALKITPDGKEVRKAKTKLEVSMRFDQCQLSSTVQIRNCKAVRLNVVSVYLFHNRFQLYAIREQPTTDLEPGETHGFLVPNSLLKKNTLKYSLLLVYRQTNDISEYLEQHHISVAEICSNAGQSSRRKHTKEIRLRPGHLDNYLPTEKLTELVTNNLKISPEPSISEPLLLDAIRYLCTTEPATRLTPANYCDMLEIMVHVCDLNVQLDLAEFKAEDAALIQMGKTRQYRVELADFDAPLTKLSMGDNVYVTVEDPKKGRLELRGSLVLIQTDYLIIELNRKLEGECRGQVSLLPDRLICRLELHALDLVRRYQLAPLFFPEEAPKQLENAKEINSWFNPSLEGNVEQQTAVRNIVNRTAYPLPYILFGPPGTGKTTTLVEAIVQICTRHPSEHILVTAQSNAACDELAVRLLHYLAPKSIYRFYSRSIEKRLEELPEPLKQISNLADGVFLWPPWETLYKTRVIVCSLTVCGRLVQGNMKPNHFRHVFVDECGSASEPATLVALAGLVSKRRKIPASVVLAGDPHQLGPVVRSELAEQMGLGMSMLERLMNLTVYQKDPESHKYNPQIITKLLRNFRSHETLLRFSNQRFYENELIALAPPQEVNFAENWSYLPNKNLPLLLHTVLGENESLLGRSRMNTSEIETVEFYLDYILRSGINGRTITQQDIGIISPYQLQVQQLRQLCERRNWPAVEVGSVEQYQGREKLIVLLSTVRSHTADVGFLNNAKRLNVAMTRAKALLVVIGNSYTLQHDPNWFDFVRFCKENGAVVGKKFDLNAARIVSQTKRQQMFAKLFREMAEVDR